MSKQTVLRCDSCKRRVEVLSEEEAMNDLEGHGWNNWKTAQHIKCFDCATDYEAYETYFAGRIKRGYPGRVYMLAPNISGRHPEKLVESYYERVIQ